MARASNPATTYTLTDFIKEGKSDNLTYNKFSIIRTTNYADMADQNMIDMYLDELKKLCIKIPIENITSEQIASYKYSPDLLAYDIYGTTQLDFIVLICNGIIDPKEFDFSFKYLVLPKASVLSQFLSDVYNSEKDWLTALNPF